MNLGKQGLEPEVSIPVNIDLIFSSLVTLDSKVGDTTKNSKWQEGEVVVVTSFTSPEYMG